MTSTKKRSAGHVSDRVIGRREYDQASAYLRSLEDFDFDEFLKKTEPSTLLNEPLGPTSTCLSVDDIAHFVQTSDRSKQGAEWVSAIEKHLMHCKECRDNARLYAVLEGEASGLPNPSQSPGDPSDDPIEAPNSKKERDDKEGMRPFIILPDTTVLVGSEGRIAEICLMAREDVLKKAGIIKPNTVVVTGAMKGRGFFIRKIAQTRRAGAHLEKLRLGFRITSKTSSAHRCDYIEITGQTVTGMSFSTEPSLVCFVQETNPVPTSRTRH